VWGGGTDPVWRLWRREIFLSHDQEKSGGVTELLVIKVLSDKGEMHFCASRVVLVFMIEFTYFILAPLL
jgi:hypothetical protein